MAITLNGQPAPVELDTPIISEYASRGWDLVGTDNRSGMVPAGYGDQLFKNIGAIGVRREYSSDKFLAEFKTKRIVVKNEGRVTLINGLIIKLQERHQLLRVGPGEVELICFGCANYVPFADMEADHFQSQKETIARMKQYWNKLLATTTFYNEQKENPLFSKMFTWIPSEKKLKMNEFFLRAYIHSSDNIWPLCHKCNGLAGKKDKDPLTFLAANENYGPDFIANLPPLNGRGILIRAGEKNEVVAQLAITWFIDRERNMIALRQFNAERRLKQEESLNKKLSVGNTKQVKKELIRFQAAGEDSDDSDSELDEKLYKQATLNARKMIHAEYMRLKIDSLISQEPGSS